MRSSPSRACAGRSFRPKPPGSCTSARRVGRPASCCCSSTRRFSGRIVELPGGPTPQVIFDYLAGEIFERFEPITQRVSPANRLPAAHDRRDRGGARERATRGAPAHQSGAKRLLRSRRGFRGRPHLSDPPACCANSCAGALRRCCPRQSVANRCGEQPHFCRRPASPKMRWRCLSRPASWGEVAALILDESRGDARAGAQRNTRRLARPVAGRNRRRGSALAVLLGRGARAREPARGATALRARVRSIPKQGRSRGNAAQLPRGHRGNRLRIRRHRPARSVAAKRSTA